MNRIALLIALAVVSASLVSACGSDQGGGGRGFTARDHVMRGADRYPTEGLIIVKADLNKDSIPDVYSVYEEDGEGDDAERRLIRKEIDVNFDGSVDIWRHYNQAEALIREELDYNFDGRVDAVNFFDKSMLVRKELDVEFDQAPDVFKYYKKGELVRVERDTDNNGKVDHWEYYERGTLDRIGRDQSGDGQVDVWEER
ncbi:MAG: hypothetical protein CMH57_06685 [Myxococcales bacterium]|nr:hypothetical protein [Myxococcales bacterium]